MFSDLYVRGIRISGELPPQEYTARLPVVRQIIEHGGLELRRRVTFLVGENGVGKSTLMEALAVAMGFNPEGGTKNYAFSTNDSHAALYRYLRVSQGIDRPKDGYFFRAESFYNAATYLEELERTPYCGGVLQSYGGKSLHHRSHGESFMALVENRFGGEGIYLLDEPESALSPARVMELMCWMDALLKKKSQFIIATHSPILITFPGAEILELTGEGIRRVHYEETELFQLTRRFLNEPQRMLRYLLR